MKYNWLLKIHVSTLRKDKLKLLLAPSPPEPPSLRLLPKHRPQSPRRLTSLLEERPPQTSPSLLLNR